MVTELYGRGAWAELTGFSCCLLSVGWFLKLISGSTRMRLIESFGFVIITATAFSIHNLSTILLLLVLLPVLIVFRMINGAPRNTPNWRSFRHFSLLGLGALMTTMFFMLPNFYFGRHTDVSKWNVSGTATYLSDPRVLLSPVLRFPPEQQKIQREAFGADVEVRLFNQTLIIFLVVTSLLVLYLLVRENSRFSQRLTVISLVMVPWLMVIIQIKAAVIMRTFPMTALIQFPYRITPYLTLSIAICTLLVFQKLQSIKVTKVVYFCFICAALWYVGLAIFQAQTSVYSAPPGFTAPNLSNIEKGFPSPLFAGNTAAPIQFRFTNTQQGSNQRFGSLNFDETGSLRKQQHFDIGFTWTDFDSNRSHILVQSGQSGRATTIGFIEDSLGRFLSVDCWGQTPRKILMKDLTAKHVSLSFEFDWSTNRALITSPSLNSDIQIDLISDELYTLRFGSNTAQSSVLQATSSTNFDVSKIRIDNSIPRPGWFRTNVVHSPLTKWTGIVESDFSNDGMWMVKIASTQPHVGLNWNFPVRLGLYLSLCGLLLVFFLLIYGLYRPA
jgi:hypothetical protein